MTAAKRQLGHLFTLLILHDSFTILAASSYHSFIISGGQTQAEKALTTLVSGPLHDHDLLVVTEDDTQGLLDLGGVVAAAGDSHTPVLLATQTSLLDTHHPDHHTKGTLLTTLLIFYNDPTAFLLLLADNTNWNPSYLVLFCLNPYLNTTSVLNQPVVQRSEYLLLLHSTLQSGLHRFRAYTSLRSREHRFIKVLLGVWSANKFPNRQSLFPPRFLNFRGYYIKVSVQCLEEPFLYFNNNGGCNGVYVDMMDILAEKLNFEFKMIPHEFLVWGYKDNGTWYGLLSDVLYKDRELATTRLQANIDQASDFDYTYPFWDVDFVFLLLLPQPLPRWKNILYPFSTLIWALVFATTVTTSAVFALLLSHYNNFSDPVNIALQAASVLLGQSGGVLSEVRAVWARVWLVTWCLMVDVLCSVYSANLVAVLSVPVYPPILHTAEELASTDIIPAMGDYGSMVPEALRTSDNPVMATLGRRLYLESDYEVSNPYKLIMERVMAGTHTLLVTGTYIAFYRSQRNFTHLTYIMEERLFPSHQSWFLRKNTPYTATLSRLVIRLLETGVLNKLYQNHLGRIMTRVKQVRGDGVLNLNHLQGAFILLALGLFAATLTLLLERLAHRHLASQHSTTPTNITSK